MFYLVFWRARAMVGDNDIFNRCAADLPLPRSNYRRDLFVVVSSVLHDGVLACCRYGTSPEPRQPAIALSNSFEFIGATEISLSVYLSIARVRHSESREVNMDELR